MSDQFPDELEQRIAIADAASTDDCGMKRSDWLALVACALVAPFLLLCLGWRQ
jgi:hypothetical protein